MTRKDYIKFAEMIRVIIKSREPQITPIVRAFVTQCIADIFADDSPRFNREKFYKACEPKEKK